MTNLALLLLLLLYSYDRFQQSLLLNMPQHLILYRSDQPNICQFKFPNCEGNNNRTVSKMLTRKYCLVGMHIHVYENI